MCVCVCTGTVTTIGKPSRPSYDISVVMTDACGLYDVGTLTVLVKSAVSLWRNDQVLHTRCLHAYRLICCRFVRLTQSEPFFWLTKKKTNKQTKKYTLIIHRIICHAILLYIMFLKIACTNSKYSTFFDCFKLLRITPQRVCVCVLCVCAVSYTHLTLPTIVGV